MSIGHLLLHNRWLQYLGAQNNSEHLTAHSFCGSGTGEWLHQARRLTISKAAAVKCRLGQRDLLLHVETSWCWLPAGSLVPSVPGGPPHRAARVAPRQGGWPPAG